MGGAAPRSSHPAKLGGVTHTHGCRHDSRVLHPPARVGHRQAFMPNPEGQGPSGFFMAAEKVGSAILAGPDDNPL